MKKTLQQHLAPPITIAMLIINCLLPAISQAQITNLHVFAGNPDGEIPTGSLFYDATTAYLYGTTGAGGTIGGCANGFGCGTIYKIKPDGTGYLKMHDFPASSTDGIYPCGSLTSDGTNLYGMTTIGGSSTICYGGCGTIFKITTTDTYTTIFNFTGTTSPPVGATPFGSLVSDGTSFYGMTKNGGLNGKGTVFKITTGGAYTNLHSFGSTGDGSNPDGSLFYDGTNLYGMTNGGGSSTICSGGCGTIFKITTTGTYTTIFNFTGTTSPPVGATPFGSLVSDGTSFYGMTKNGGLNGKGTVFKITTGGAYTNLHSFGSTGDGSNPDGSLFYDGTNLYGMTNGGGSSTICSGGCGTIFKIATTGLGYIKLVDFNGTNGANPYGGSLISNGTFLYGTTSGVAPPPEGQDNTGTAFQYHDCTLPLTISTDAVYNGSIWSSNIYSTVTIGTISTNTITATTNQVFKFSSNTTVNGPFTSGTGGNTLNIVPTPCP